MNPLKKIKKEMKPAANQRELFETETDKLLGYMAIDQYGQHISIILALKIIQEKNCFLILDGFKKCMLMA